LRRHFNVLVHVVKSPVSLGGALCGAPCLAI
jgi:hypothetical protein